MKPPKSLRLIQTKIEIAHEWVEVKTNMAESFIADAVMAACKRARMKTEAGRRMADNVLAEWRKHVSQRMKYERDNPQTRTTSSPRSPERLVSRISRAFTAASCNTSEHRRVTGRVGHGNVQGRDRAGEIGTEAGGRVCAGLDKGAGAQRSRS
jgi:hypothetical protein